MSATTLQLLSDQQFLEMRARLLEIAAGLDRISREANQSLTTSAAVDPRLAKLLDAIHLLQTDEDGRAEKVQLHFSRPYDNQWRNNFGL